MPKASEKEIRKVCFQVGTRLELVLVWFWLVLVGFGFGWSWFWLFLVLLLVGFGFGFGWISLLFCFCFGCFCFSVRSVASLRFSLSFLNPSEALAFAGALGALLAAVLFQLGYFAPLSSRVRGLFVKSRGPEGSRTSSNWMSVVVVFLCGVRFFFKGKP